MSDIAAEIGVTAPLLLHYFGSKNELIIEALVAVDEPYLLKLRERVRGGERARAAARPVRGGLHLAARGQDWWRQASAIWMNAWITAMHDPAIARAREAEDRRWRDR